MQAFFGVLISIAILFLYLGLRYLWIIAGLKDNNSGAVQHSSRAIPPNLSQEPFLPGSRAGMGDAVAQLQEEMKQGLKIQTFKKRSNAYRPFSSKQDIRRSYIIDAILERPKWSENQNERP